ncbi:AI-2E family transporter [Calidifontibacillus oryziterrae]|uniref:AI-2E family transporter n=1 Tax=Calidifontibacillus oryziterrae TaxID=1191699 RepID=UPI000305E41E|nr:AI-2E family transporter [Calidifontibacillus oryziterrae]
MGNHKYVWLIRAATLLITLLCLFVFIKLLPIWEPIGKILLTALTPLLISSFIAYLLLPVVEFIHARRVPRVIAILAIYVVFFGGIGFGLYKLIPQLLNQFKDLNENIPYLVNTYRHWINEIDFRTEHFPEGIHQRIEEGLHSIESGIDQLLTTIAVFLKELLNSLILFALIPLIVFYMLKDISLFKKAIWYVTPRKWRRPGIQLLKQIDESLGNYIRGQLFVCLLIGIVATASFWIVGMNYPLILGTIIGITNIIPYFGPFIGAIPAIIVAITLSGKMVLIVAMIIVLLQFLEGNILAPLIVGKSLHMHPVVIIITLLVGEELAGVIGMILAVPVIAILREVIFLLVFNLKKTRSVKN